MTKEELMTKREALLGMLDAYKKTINLNWSEVADEFIKTNSDLKKGTVYELKENGVRRRGYKRFVIYQMEVKVYLDTPCIKVGGWWLNAKNVPEKWDTMTVSGVGNPAIFEISTNQANEPRPESTPSIHGN